MSMAEQPNSCVIGHASPSPKIPWKDWACASCVPDLYEAMTFPGDPQSSKVECPLCLNKVPYVQGLMRPHGVDTIDRCLASGVSVEVAQALLTALLFRQTVDQMLDSVKVCRIPENTEKAISGGVFKLQLDLGAIRKAQGILTGTELASILGMHQATMSTWETGDAPANLDQTIRWCAALNHRIILHTAEGDDYPVSDALETLLFLQSLRVQSGRTLKEVSVKIGYGSNSHLGEYERGKRTNLNMDRFAKWVATLGLIFTLEEIKLLETVSGES